jgi:hypothetical protein
VGAELLKRRDRGEMLRSTLERAGTNKGDMVRWKLEESKDWSCSRNGKKEKGERDEQRRASTGTVRVILVKKMKRIGKRGIWWKIWIAMIPEAGSMSRAMVVTSTSVIATRTRNLRPRGWNRRRELHQDLNETSKAWKERPEAKHE